jgi:RNA polymerase sigma factor (sigma-70 family)
VNIDLIENAKYITQQAWKFKKEFPTIDLSDIIQELNLLIIQFCNGHDKYGNEFTYDPLKGKVTTFIAKYPARKLRQVLISKYVNHFYKDSKAAFVTTVSMDVKMDENEGSIDYKDSFEIAEAYNNQYGEKFESENFEFKKVIETIKDSNLNDKEKEVIIKRFGLNGEVPKTLEQVGKELDLTRERIRIIEKNAKRKLKTNKFLQQLV